MAHAACLEGGALIGNPRVHLLIPSGLCPGDGSFHRVPAVPETEIGEMAKGLKELL